MYESKSFVYLDLQKTGTKFIIDFLRRFSSEGKGKRKKHKPVGVHNGTGKLYFISVRDPFDQYVSLYSYGCGGKGAVFDRLKRHGRADLYRHSAQGFQYWLEFVLDPSNALLLDARYASAANGRAPTLIGFQSFRFLNLAFRAPGQVFARCATKQDLLEAYRSESIISVTIRHSQFVSDLQSLVKTHLASAIADLDGAMKFLDEAPALNTSNRVDKDHDLKIDQRASDLLHEREWLYYEGFVKT